MPSPTLNLLPRRRPSLAGLSMVLAVVFAGLTAAPVCADDAPRPNVLVILADDMGFADVGCYGGEVRTPNLDALAHNGLRFTQFYNTARCWTTRISLISGYYHDQLNNQTSWRRALPQLLKPAGYRSYHSGKWHLERWFHRPLANAGFDRSYFYNENDRFYSPRQTFIDDVRQPPVQRGTGYFGTVAKTDYMIAFLKEHAQDHAGTPFFAYLAYTCPHFPLHAEQHDIDKYAGQFEDGWDAYRARVVARQKAMGLIDTPLSMLEPQILAPSGNAEQRERLGPGEVAHALDWDDLTDEQQAFQAMKMRIHAAMIDRMDHEIGRVVDQLKAMGAYENTLILFLSDNGASAEIMTRGDGHDPEARPGSADSYLCLGPGWSSASNTPFRRHKIWTHEGGIATPLIAHWPAGIRDKGELRHEPSHLVDFTPTFLSLAGIEPRNPAPDAPRLPGLDLTPVFASDQALDRDAIYFNHAGNRALRVGDWKIVSAKMDDNRWELYDLSVDRAEQNDLADKHPQRLAAMIARWEQMTAQFTEDRKR